MGGCTSPKCHNRKVTARRAVKKPREKPVINQGKKELPQWMGQDKVHDKLWTVATPSNRALSHLPLMKLETKDEASFLLRQCIHLSFGVISQPYIPLVLHLPHGSRVFFLAPARSCRALAFRMSKNSRCTDGQKLPTVFSTMSNEV